MVKEIDYDIRSLNKTAVQFSPLPRKKITELNLAPPMSATKKLSPEKAGIRNKWVGDRTKSNASNSRGLVKTAQPAAKTIVESLLDGNDI